MARENCTPGIPTLVVWGAGWAAALAVAFVALNVGCESLSFAHYAAAVVVGGLAFGVPIRHGARAIGSPRATAQAVVWACAFAAAALALGSYYEEITALAKPGDLNINTTETMRQRTGESYPPGVLFSSAVILAFGMVSGLASALLASHGSTIAAAVRGIAFGVAAVAGLVVGGVLTLVTLPILAHVVSMGARGGPAELAAAMTGAIAGAFLAGAGTGLAIERARRVLFGSHG